ncbi:hypothetical protein [Tropicibacter naphthalenivorans]|uniref:D-galactarate dehydratase n=1 Tax=Tropicibacter naphthalenivorans TaxID=441103 RepID=A0A0N7M0E4_9RHOB|nr:hypothetical protein [Tropicibacter naphthalenivorans]CUH80233.1 hypothetical protein TRN7648_02885 [Tropicibacter naphthalenivorans]SMC85603.1 hypothetical protein SAMN04488093_105154 [Tropicibacter naphthalenivorans]
MKTGFVLIGALALAGCGKMPLGLGKPDAPAPAAQTQTRPQARPEGAAAPVPQANARTVEQFDTTTAAERAEAAAAPEPAGETKLGTTVASLGDPSKPGFWLETPLVSSASKGRVFFPATGKSAQVDLIPIDGPATGGSRLSLAAMRLIEAPLTDLPTIEVFTGG